MSNAVRRWVIQGQRSFPWYDIIKDKGYRQIPGQATPDKALGVVPGPKGIALACFATCCPQEIRGVSNDMLPSKARVMEKPLAPLKGPAATPKAPHVKVMF